VEAPSKDTVTIAVREIRRDVAEEATEWNVTAIVLVTESHDCVGTGLFGWALNSGVVNSMSELAFSTENLRLVFPRV
jgi:hypothetical protein